MKEKKKKWAYFVCRTLCPFPCPPALSRGFPSLLAHLRPPVVILLYWLLGLTWCHSCHIAAILAVLFRVLAVFQHIIDGHRGGRSWGEWGTVGGWWGDGGGAGDRGVDGIDGTSQVSCECGHVTYPAS